MTDIVQVTAPEPVPVPVLTDLSAREQELVRAARHGTALVCGTLSSAALVHTTTAAYVIRARLIRELLLGRHGDLDPHGVRLEGAHIAGELDLDYLDTTVGLELVGCAFAQPITARGAHLPRLTLTRGHLDVLHADGLRVAGDVLLEQNYFSGHNEHGVFRLSGARIGGQLDCERVQINNPLGVALFADDVQVGSELVLRKAQIAGSSDRGALRLDDARIGGQLNAFGLRCDNDAGPALCANDIQIGGNLLLLNGRFRAGSAIGTIRLHGAHIKGSLIADRMQCDNDAGPTLHADGIQVGGSLSLENARVTGDSDQCSIRLHSARINGQLAFRELTIFNGAARGIELQGATVDDAVFLPAELVCSQPWGRSCPCSRRIGLEDFTFGALAYIDWREWLHLVRFHTDDYSPSPYQRLASMERAAGHDGNARRILIAQQQDLLRRTPTAIGGKLTQGFHRLWGALAGYGYRARRTAAALLLALAAAAALGLWAGHIDTHPGYAAERTTASGTASRQCSPVELIGLGLDRGLPLAPTGLRTRCDLDTTTTPGQLFTVAVWLVQAAVWILATLALAGYTGLIRKPA